MDKIIVQEENFDLTTEVKLAIGNDSSVGAVVSFVGIVRDLDHDSIEKMTLEYYPRMTQKSLLFIANQARKRWEIGDITVIHRFGELKVHEQIVLVVTTSKHRKSAFESCEFIMDFLKTKAPFWKKEYTNSGSSRWVDSKAQDENQVDRWEN